MSTHPGSDLSADLGDPQLPSDLAATLCDVLSTVLSDEAARTDEPFMAGPAAVARLAIHDELTGIYMGVEVRVGTSLARVLACRMLSVAAPVDEDIVDAVAELGNITAGSAKSLLFKHARLSLPSSEIVVDQAGPASPGEQQVRAIVLGHVIQLTIVPGADPGGLLWPPAAADELLGRL